MSLGETSPQAIFPCQCPTMPHHVPPPTLFLPTLATLSANHKHPTTHAAIGRVCLFPRLSSHHFETVCFPGRPKEAQAPHPERATRVTGLTHASSASPANSHRPHHFTPSPSPFLHTHHNCHLQHAAEESVLLHRAAVGFIDGQKETSRMSCLCPIPHLLSVPRAWLPLPPPSLPALSTEQSSRCLLLFHFLLVLFGTLYSRFPISSLTRGPQEGQRG